MYWNFVECFNENVSFGLIYSLSNCDSIISFLHWKSFGCELVKNSSNCAVSSHSSWLSLEELRIWNDLQLESPSGFKFLELSGYDSHLIHLWCILLSLRECSFTKFFSLPLESFTIPDFTYFNLGTSCFWGVKVTDVFFRFLIDQLVSALFWLLLVLPLAIFVCFNWNLLQPLAFFECGYLSSVCFCSFYS